MLFQHAPFEQGPAETQPDAMQTLGNHSRQLIQAIQKLETLSIDATLPSLPKFVVVGDQSAGKSSIIEGICSITLPRSQGTCTRSVQTAYHRNPTITDGVLQMPFPDHNHSKQGI